MARNNDPHRTGGPVLRARVLPTLAAEGLHGGAPEDGGGRRRIVPELLYGSVFLAIMKVRAGGESSEGINQ